jgi:23S rRNA (uracil1939-C5)-methyltransferase
MPLLKKLSEVEILPSLDLNIDIQGWKGEGLTKIEDGWMTIHGGLAGESVRVKPHLRPHPSRRRIDAEILDVLNPDPMRVATGCEKFNFCHGCQLRMISWEAENQFKEQKVSEILRKYANVDLPVGNLAVENLDRRTGLRNRARVRIQDGVAGLTSLGKLVEMRDCPALTERAQHTLDIVATHLDGEDIDHVEILAPHSGPALVSIEARRIPSGLDQLINDDLGIRVSMSKKVLWQQGPLRTFSRAGNHLLQTSFDAWVPASEAASVPLYAWIEACGFSGKLAIDLGCGIGGVTRQMSASFDRIIGVDADLNAMACYADNFQNHPHITPMPGAFEKALRQLCQQNLQPDLITVNPMREPVGPLVHSLVRHLNPQKILYLGPSPASAAKDLAAWQTNWHIERVFQANVHPHTHHTMLIAVLNRAHD